jgi:hypothetical protein
MSPENYRRPWWLIVNKPQGLITTIREEPSPGERVFVIRGEPVVQGLAWLTWGPVAALLAVVVVAVLAISFEVREQSGVVRALFIAAFLALPALGWGIITLIFSRLSEKHLQRERDALAQECVIRFNQEQGQLFYRTTQYPDEKKLDYAEIRQVRVAYPLGAKQNMVPRLIVETEDGPLILLGEALGSQSQKVDLANEMQMMLKRYARQ